MVFGINSSYIVNGKKIVLGFALHLPIYARSIYPKYHSLPSYCIYKFNNDTDNIFFSAEG